MNEEQTIARFKQGKEAWNAWAEEMLTEKAQLIKDGLWETNDQIDSTDFSRESSKWFQKTQVVISNQNIESFSFLNLENLDYLLLGRKNASSDTIERSRLLEDHDKYIDFSGFIFPGRVSFKKVGFDYPVFFEGTIFHENADFRNTKFASEVYFSNAAFYKRAIFNKAIFNKRVTFYNAELIYNSSFVKAKFKKAAIFHATKFYKDDSVFSFTDFTDTKFDGDTTFFSSAFRLVHFKSAIFNDNCNFARSKFFGACLLSNATFAGLNTTFQYARFFLAQFDGISVTRAFDFCGASFSRLPNFIQAHFAEAPRLDDFKLEPDVFGVPSKSDIAMRKETCAKWRALRRLATQGHDHENELKFLAGEIRSRRGVYDKKYSPAYIFGLCYEYLSDFGASIGLPLLWLFGSTLFFALMYFLMQWGMCASYFGVSGASPYTAFETSLEGLTKIASFNSTLSWMNLLQSIQKVFNATLLFLFGLALRNRFKVK